MTGFLVHPISSPDAALLFARHKLSPPQLVAALRGHQEKHASCINTIVGVASADLIYSTETDWSPEAPDAFDDLCIIPWVLIHELLGIVPDGTTDDFLKSGGQQ